MKSSPFHFLILCWLLTPVLWAEESYRVEQVKVPKGIVLEVSGMDYSQEGVLYLATRRGDVWTEQDGHWRRFAHGLHEPTGLCIGSKGEVFVSQRPEITRLIDEDGDGFADLYRTITDDFSMVASFHQYTYGLVQDHSGNLWGTLSGTGITNADGLPGDAKAFSSEPHRMWSYKVTLEGEFVPWSSGLRTANGIGMNLEGERFVTDNQGDWVGTPMLHHLSKGAFHGHADALKWDERFKGKDDPTEKPANELDSMRKMPAVHLPHGELMNSPSSPLCDRSAGKFGPFTGQFFIGDIVHPTLVRVALEKVNGQYQGACFPFLKGNPKGGGLKTGLCRLAFTPNGSLLIGRVGQGDWKRGLPGQGFQRIDYTGKTPFEIHRIELQKNGFKLHFTKALELKKKLTPQQFELSNYHYAYTSNYGTPKTDLKAIPITAIKPSADGTSALLQVPELQARKIYQFHLKNLTDTSGQTLKNNTAYYTLNKLK